MKNVYRINFFALIFCLLGCSSNSPHSLVEINVYPDSIINDVSNHPLGINMDYLMDDDNYLQPQIRTADALKAMGVKYLRYPGGNKSDFYFFSKPPYEKSQPTLARTGPQAVSGRNRALNATATDFKHDVLDFDEFIALCREINAEPIIVVAADEYLVNYPKGSTWSTKDQLLREAVEWVKYANVKKKYSVKFWMIGNESWGRENQNSTAEIYAQDVVDFSRAMKAIDPSIKIIPNANGPDFWRTVLLKTAGYIDAVCLSNYAVRDYRAGYATYRDTLQNLIGGIQIAKEAIDTHTSLEVREKLKIIVAEHGPFDWGEAWPHINDMGHNLVAFETAGEQLMEPRIEFSMYWNTRWIENDSVEYSAFDALNKQGQLNAIGQGLMIWGRFIKDKMVRTTNSLHVRSFASLSADGKSLNLFLLNKSEKDSRVNMLVKGLDEDSSIVLNQLTSSGSSDVRPVWSKNISVSSKELGSFKLPPVSISVLSLKLNKQR